MYGRLDIARLLLILAGMLNKGVWVISDYRWMFLRRKNKGLCDEDLAGSRPNEHLGSHIRHQLLNRNPSNMV